MNKYKVTIELDNDIKVEEYEFPHNMTIDEIYESICSDYEYNVEFENFNFQIMNIEKIKGGPIL